MKFLSSVLMLAVLGLLLVSSGGAPISPRILPVTATAAPTPVAVPAPISPQRRHPLGTARALDDREKNAALGFLLLFAGQQPRHER